MARKQIQADLRSYGIYQGWDRKSRDLPEILHHTRSIPAIVGTEFGYIVRIRKARGKWLRWRIAHPEVPGKDGQPMAPFEGRERIPDSEFLFFLGDAIWEPPAGLAGPWILTVWVDDAVVAKERFHVHLPETIEG